MFITQKFKTHLDEVKNFSETLNQNLDHSIQNIQSNDRIYCVVTTGRFYGINNVTFSKEETNSYFYKSTIPYTLSALLLENENIEALLKNLENDFNEVTNNEDFQALKLAITQLKDTTDKLDILFKAVKAGHEQKISSPADAENFNNQITRLESNKTKVNKLNNLVATPEFYRRRMAIEIFEQIKEEISTIDIESERKHLNQFTNQKLNDADIDRSTIVVDNCVIPQNKDINEKIAIIKNYLNNDNAVYENLIKSFHQGMAQNITLKLSTTYFPHNMATGNNQITSQNRFEFKKDLLTNTLKITLNTIYPITDIDFSNYPSNDDQPPQFPVLCRINGSIDVVVDIDDLREGNFGTAEFKYNFKILEEN